MSRSPFLKVFSEIIRNTNNGRTRLMRRKNGYQLMMSTSSCHHHHRHHHCHHHHNHHRCHHHMVDLRSDTVTKPTPQMKQAMMDVEVGDDIKTDEDDPAVHELQKAFAEKVGKEDALFVPTCTMANIIAVMVQCEGRLNEAILGSESHILHYEMAAVTQLGGIQGRAVPNLPDGTMDLHEMERSIRVTQDDLQPLTQVVCLENTHNRCGGKVLPLEFIHSVRQLVDKNHLKLHIDGARLFNAAVASGVPAAEIVSPAHTVALAFSKGLCCPVGSIVAGSEEFVYLARNARKALGGGMRQAGVLAAPALYALDKMVDRLKEDHQRAKGIAEAIDSLQSNPVCCVDIDGVQTNIILVHMIGNITPQQFAERMSQVTEHERKILGESISARMFPFPGNCVRCVTHHDIKDEDVHKMEKKFKYVIEEFSNVTQVQEAQR